VIFQPQSKSIALNPETRLTLIIIYYANNAADAYVHRRYGIK